MIIFLAHINFLYHLIIISGEDMVMKHKPSYHDKVSKIEKPKFEIIKKNSAFWMASHGLFKQCRINLLESVIFLIRDRRPGLGVEEQPVAELGLPHLEAHLDLVHVGHLRHGAGNLSDLSPAFISSAFYALSGCTRYRDNVTKVFYWLYLFLCTLRHGHGCWHFFSLPIWSMTLFFFW